MADDDDKKPLEDPKVKVSVDTQRGKQGSGTKIKRGVEKEVKDAIEKNKDKGARKQLDAAEDAVEKAQKQVSNRDIKKIKVKVEGTVDGDKVSREKEVTPKD